MLTIGTLQSSIFDSRSCSYHSHNHCSSGGRSCHSLGSRKKGDPWAKDIGRSFFRLELLNSEDQTTFLVLQSNPTLDCAVLDNCFIHPPSLREHSSEPLGCNGDPIPSQKQTLSTTPPKIIDYRITIPSGNETMEHHPFIDDFPMKNRIFPMNTSPFIVDSPARHVVSIVQGAARSGVGPKLEGGFALGLGAVDLELCHQ